MATDRSEHGLSDVIEVQAQWDEEAGAWWVESADLPGLVSEAPTLDALIERVSSVIPDLLAVAEGPLATGSPPRRVVFRIDRMVEIAA
jgi:predicted RNase H-like HicB family nuclease